MPPNNRDLWKDAAHAIFNFSEFNLASYDTLFLPFTLAHARAAAQRRSRGATMLKSTATGFAWMALSALFQDRAFAVAPIFPQPHFAPRARNVIFLFMDGGVSHVDTFDPKPELTKRDGQISTKGNQKVGEEPVGICTARPERHPGQ